MLRAIGGLSYGRRGDVEKQVVLKIITSASAQWNTRIALVFIIHVVSGVHMETAQTATDEDCTYHSPAEGRAYPQGQHDGRIYT